MIGFHKSTEPFEFDESKWFEHEKPSVLKAFRTLGKEGYYVTISGHDYDMRKKRLKEEYEKSTKAPDPCEEQPKEDNPALKEAASQFNDSLLDEQAKKIEEFTKKNVRLGEEIVRLNKAIYKKNMKIEELRKESSRHLRGKIKVFYENRDLMETLRKTESLLNDTREANSKNLDTCFKNEDIIDDLKKKLAEKTKLVKKYAKELSDSSLNLCKLEKKLKDKNAILSDVAEELRLTKIREKNLAELGLKYVGENEKLKKELADKVVDKIDAQALKSAESALAEKDEVIADLGKELAEAKKLNTAKMLDFNAKCMKAARESINDVFESYAAKYAKSTLDDLKEKVYNSFNAKACKLGLVGSKDGNGIHDQMEEDTHPTEDNPEEVEMDEILERVRKALEEGHTVSIDYDKAEEGGDRSATIVECGKDIVDLFKETKRLWQD